MEEEILFKTLVGSHMWGMNTPESDKDIMVVFMQDTKSILSGYPLQTGKQHVTKTEDGVEIDYQYMEIGHLINLLIKGNVNALWTVTSPCNVCGEDNISVLREITIRNLSTRLYPSIKGMAISQMNDEWKRESMKGKGFRTALRTLIFGTTIFETGKLVYAPVGNHVTKQDVETGFKEFQHAYAHTNLPEEPDEQQFRNYLYLIRLSGLQSGLRI
jgi:predicted nucleotidyltransferase